MTTRDQRACLISPDDVDAIFDSEIDVLAQIARISKAKTPAFGVGVRQSVKEFLHDAQRLHPGEIHDIVKEFERAITKALEETPGGAERVAQILSKMPGQTRDFLIRNASLTGHSLPTSEEILDPDQGRETLKLLWCLCTRGAKIVPGRLRPGGKQSRRTLKIEYASPTIRRGRSRDDSEFFLCVSIGGHYFKATGGKMPSRKKWNQGPFVELIERVLYLVGADPKRFSADELVRRYESYLKDK